MPKIKKLDKNLANQIAAWEVVERPVSVVKELVENSIDAKASNITIELKNAWIEEIIISDNWEWIEYEDLKIVFDKYTTSKISSLEDLYKIMTFGFRWEALSSISSVAKTTIISKTKNSLVWYKISYIDWKKSEIEEVPFETGTKVIVKNLFYNTPARLNYLKKPRTEFNKIKEFVEQISLSYPEIWFELINDNKKILFFREKENLKTRIYKIFWEEFANNLLEINYELVWLKITGYISDPKIAFSNKNKQVIFVNNRIIKSPLISKAISDAYNRFIAHSEFPWYVLNILIDPTLVDVNVHPRKLEVRFAKEDQIFRWFYHAIEEKLNSVSLISTDLSITNNQNIKQNIWNSKNNYYKPEIKQEKYYTGSGTKFKAYSPYKNTKANPNQFSINNAINFSKEIIKQTNNSIDTLEQSNDLHYTPLWKIIGQLHNSYIIVETNDWMQILDQHALAERIIYEKLQKQKNKFNTQGLLIWETIKLTTKELEILQENKQTFIEMWFEFEFLDSTIIMINAIPDFIKKEDLKKIFTGILDDIWEYNFSKSKTLEEVRNKIFAYTACRSAIKFWNKLSLFEMNKLLKDASLDYSATCPHWRPVVFSITLEELKWKYER